MKVSRENRLGLLFTSPFLLGFVVFSAYPLLASLWYSFCAYDLITPPVFVGLDNYRELAHDPHFLQAAWNTVVFAALVVPLTMGLALLLALLLHLKLRGQALYRALFFLPSIVPVVASGVLWLWLFNADYGFINICLRPLLSALNHLTGAHLAPPGWINDPHWVLPALLIMSAWGVGGNVILYLAALGDVPRHLCEAAEVDGAGAWAKVRHVTLPMISPVLFFTLIMGLIGAFQVFAHPMVIWPNGGPADSATFFATYIFINAFVFLRMGYASAQAWVLFLVIIAATWLAFRATRRFVYHDGEGG